VHTTNKKYFVIDFAIATKSILSIAKALFHETPHFKYVLSYKFSQDHIEILLSRFRQKFGSNNNPNILQFKTALKQILMKNAITCKTNGNCNIFDNDVFGV
jgi:DNA transposase THAP9